MASLSLPGRSAGVGWVFGRGGDLRSRSKIVNVDSIKGAIMLRQRFENRVSPTPAERVAASEDAPPIVHWIAAGQMPEVSGAVDSDSEA